MASISLLPSNKIYDTFQEHNFIESEVITPCLDISAASIPTIMQ